MATFPQWVEGARPRTWPAAFAPVAAGTGAAIHHLGGLDTLTSSTAPLSLAAVLVRAALALAVALSLQIGVNYANDYSDGVRGTDDDRVGPFRLTASGAAQPGTVKAAAFGSLGAGALFGLVLIAISGIWWTILIGAAAVAAAWFYTGGKKPYGYLGLGELFVFVFFGLVAVNGTAYAITGTVPWTALLASIAIGLLAVAIMLTNNLRDIPTDAETGKRTLAVRLGDRGTRALYAASILVPFLLVVPIAWEHRPVLVTLVASLLISPPLTAVQRGASGRDLIPVLGQTGRIELAYSVLLLVGFLL